jgi:hypothetical protein
MGDSSVTRAFFEKIAEIMPGECNIREVSLEEVGGGECIQFSYGGATIRAEVKDNNLMLHVVAMPMKVTFSALPQDLQLVKIPMADPELFDRVPRVLEGYINRSIDEDIEKYEKMLKDLKEMRAIKDMKEKLIVYLGSAE